MMVKKKFDLTDFWDVFVIVLLLMIMVSIVFFTTLVSASNITDNQKENFCIFMNYSYFDCFDLWESIEFNCTNNTEIINNTQYVNITIEKNCSEVLELKQAEWRHEEEMAKIRKNDSIVVTDCNEFCEDKIREVEAQYSNPGNQAYQGSSAKEVNNTPYFLFAGLIGIFIVIIVVINKFNLNKYKVVKQPTYAENFYKPPVKQPSPKPPVKQPSPKPPEPDPVNEDSGLEEFK